MAKAKTTASGMSGKTLVKLLRESGTGETKLNVGRAVLAAKPTATAEAVLAALQKADGVGEGTIEKAEQIMRDGKYVPPVKVEDTPIEDEPD